MSFLDYILAGFGVYEMKDDLQKQPFKKPTTKTKPQPANFMPTKETKPSPVFEVQKNQVAFFCPKNTQQVVEIARFLASNQPAMVDTTHLPKNIFQNCLDFLIGAKTALNAHIKQLENGFLMFVPNGTQLVEFLEEKQ